MPDDTPPDYAAGYRAGWRARGAEDEAVMRRRICASGGGPLITDKDFVAALGEMARLPEPEPREEPDGLSYRGG